METGLAILSVFVKVSAIWPGRRELHLVTSRFSDPLTWMTGMT